MSRQTEAIAECLAVLRPAVKGKFPHEQALEELVGYIAVPQPAQQEPADATKIAAHILTYLGFSQDESVYPGADRRRDTVAMMIENAALQPAQRTWVGLTDEELMYMYNEPRSDAEMIAFGREVEAALRSKNT